MFPTFSGSGRRPRQVNLSGRQTSNPFANNQFGGQFRGGAGPSTALANAHQDRIVRQQERERAQAAKSVQRVWRGHAARRKLKAARRQAWDENESTAGLDSTSDAAHAAPYVSDDEALTQLNLLLFFLDLGDELDLARLQRFDARWKQTPLGQAPERQLDPSFRRAYLKLERKCIESLLLLQQHQSKSHSTHQAKVLPVLRSTALQIPEETALHSRAFFQLMARLLANADPAADDYLLTLPLRAATAPALSAAYENLATALLAEPNLSESLGQRRFDALAARLDCSLLGSALAHKIRRSSDRPSQAFASLSCDSRLWLLAHFIYVYRATHGFNHSARYACDEDFIIVVGTLLASLVDEIELEPSFAATTYDEPDPTTLSAQRSRAVPSFVKTQIASLINQESIGGLLSLVDDVAPSPEHGGAKFHSRVLATYILTLLRLFPRRGDEIRMWLYLGLRSDKTAASQSRPPVVRYFWQAVCVSDVFRAISLDSRAAIQLLRPAAAQDTPRSNLSNPDADDEWRVVLIFLELYIFVLKVMDDDEFFADGRGPSSRTLSLVETQALTTFLKNLGFTMYYNAPDITGAGLHKDVDDISQLFKITDEDAASSAPATHRKPEAANIAGVQGVSLDYVKGLVTGILRQIYARDSRRPFLPKNHWLMTSRFDMTNFIDSVVEEEERRNRVQQQEDEEHGGGGGADDLDNNDDNDADRLPRLVGQRQTAQILRIQQTQRQQRKASRQRYLQQVAPRLEILQNMPFLIPFTTRVQIFRRFVHLDKIKRRGGTVDGDLWRMNQMADPMRGAALTRHHANIRREHEFQDAFEQYYELGAGLKEPIQITFIDKFGAIEAGIDGGGVTKEFLTSVTSQAFASTEGVKLFAENEQHLLYPNPSALDEQREYLLNECLVPENDPAFRPAMQELLKRFEFLGRIIGKCLYEGILVDIGFAGFFLLKWALTGGTNSAPRESGYRASINDLREFDESLYQGLLTLKNYPGDVERDFSLDFTVSDTLSTSDGAQKTVTRELRPGGAQVAVTNANRLVYIAEVSRHRLQQQPYHQTNAFLRGLAAVVEPSWLSMFNQVELQTLVGGTASSISVPDLRRHTIYGGVYSIGDDGLEHPSVRIFWEVMESLPDEERRKVLKFVTSTPRAPLLGFASLNPRFSIRDAGADETRLPSTSTCVNLLKLPRYSSVGVCRGKLLQAVNSGAGFDLS